MKKGTKTINSFIWSFKQLYVVPFLAFSIMLLSIFPLYAQNIENTVDGTVSAEGEPLQHVSISIKGTSRGLRSGVNGDFSINAKPGDVLVFSHLGMQTAEIEVTGASEFLNVVLFPKVVELDEVTVKKKKRKTQKDLLAEYPTNKRLIKTSWGIVDKDRASYSMHLVDGKDLIPVGPDFLTSLQNFYPPMRVVRNDSANTGEITVYLQTWSYNSSPTAIFDVDGHIYETVPTFIDVHNIDRVAILVRNGAFFRYGPRGTGGVIIINTKEQARVDDLGVERTFDNSQLRDSIYDQLNEPPSFTEVASEYMKVYHDATSEQEAFAIFENQGEKHVDAPYYVIEVAHYFLKQWGNREKSQELLQYVENHFSTNAYVLRAVAYTFEEQGAYEKALEVYLKILKLASREAQSHRDVANAYVQMGNFQKALNVYARYELAINELDTIPFDKYGTDFLMTTESVNSIRLSGSELTVDEDILNDGMEDHATRLVFEWNDEQAEFELQFVNPQKLYDSWENSEDSDDQVLPMERLKGYRSKQFFLDDGIKGEWQVNIDYFGNKTDSPTYLKATIYRNYGKPTQIHEIKVFPLSQQDSYTSLFTVDTNKSISN